MTSTAEARLPAAPRSMATGAAGDLFHCSGSVSRELLAMSGEDRLSWFRRLRRNIARKMDRAEAPRPIQWVVEAHAFPDGTIDSWELRALAGPEAAEWAARARWRSRRNPYRPL